jgi:HAMP domain-containing protein
MIPRGRLFWKYVVLFAVEVYSSYQESKSFLVALQREKAQAAAARIEAFVREIERQMDWVTQPQTVAPALGLEQRRLDYLRLQRQVPAITELSYLDASGREQLRVSRVAMEVVGSQTDLSAEPSFRHGRTRTWYGPVYFRKESEPYMSIAAPHVRGGGVTIAEVNLKFIWDVVSRISIGKAGRAYVVDRAGMLIAHPDISLVLQKTSLASLEQVKAALAAPVPGTTPVDVPVARDVHGRQVLTASATMTTLGWTVLAEQPVDEAFEPLRTSMYRTAVLILFGIGMSVVASVVLARRMVRPIRALEEGAARIGAGELGHRIDVRTRDEFETLAGRFNEMTGRLQESHATLEQRVEERTRELSEALEQQTATAEILRTISGSLTDTRPVFQAIAENAVRLCRGTLSAVALVTDDVIHLVALHNVDAQARKVFESVFPLPLGEAPVSAALLRDGAPIQFTDLDDEASAPPQVVQLARAAGYRSLVWVPMQRDERGIGFIYVARHEPDGFGDAQIEVLKTFADQAVIAIENSRLFTELQEKNRAVTEALEQQTATSDILRIISSSPTNVEPVFGAVATSAARLCEAQYAGVMLVKDGALAIQLGEGYALPPQQQAMLSRRTSRSAGR